MNLALGLVQTVILSSQTLSMVSTLTTDILIGSITATTGSIFSLLKTITASSQTGIREYVSQIKNIDLEFTITILDQLVKEQEGKILQESVKKALFGVSDILTNIHDELKVFHDSIGYHNTKYFSGWRSFSCMSSIDVIKQYNEILRNRYNMLFELLKIYNKIKD